MTVKDLKIIYEYALEHNFELNYSKLTQYQENDIHLITEKIKEKNQNIKILMAFFAWELNNPSWQERFSSLCNIEKIDIRNYLVHQILNASSIEKAKKILFYFGTEEYLKLFSTVEDWKTYIECINENMNDCTQENVALVLKNAVFDKQELIKEVMKYSQNKEFASQTINTYMSPMVIKKYLKEILCLLNLGYPIIEVAKFFKNRNYELENGMESYGKLAEQTYEYLKNNNYTDDKTNLIGIFNQSNITQYDNILGFLRRIETQKDQELFNKVLKFKRISNPTMRLYYSEILLSDLNISRRKSLLELLDKNIISIHLDDERIIKSILKILETTQKIDGDTTHITTFIEKMPILEILDKMVITKENLDTRNIIYREFTDCLKTESLTEEEVTYYGIWLEELCKLPVDICQKMIKILKLSTVKDLSLEGRNELRKLLLSKENFGSLDYVYNQYLQKEEIDSEKEKNSILLNTVIGSLENGADILEVLKDFNEDDEITENTLIRSITFKSN